MCFNVLYFLKWSNESLLELLYIYIYMTTFFICINYICLDIFKTSSVLRTVFKFLEQNPILTDLLQDSTWPEQDKRIDLEYLTFYKYHLGIFFKVKWPKMRHREGKWSVSFFMNNVTESRTIISLGLRQYFVHKLSAWVKNASFKNSQCKQNNVMVEALRYEQCSETSTCNCFRSFVTI